MVDDYNKIYTDKYKSDYTNVIINDQNVKLKEENEALKAHLNEEIDNKESNNNELKNEDKENKNIEKPVNIEDQKNLEKRV